MKVLWYAPNARQLFSSAMPSECCLVRYLAKSSSDFEAFARFKNIFTVPELRYMPHSELHGLYLRHNNQELEKMMDATIYIEDEKIKTPITKMIDELGYHATICHSSNIKYSPDVLYLLQSSDIFTIMKIVYELYLEAKDSTRPCIIAMIDKDMFAQNQRLAYWVIQGYAALLCLIPYNGYLDTDNILGLSSLIRRIDKQPTESRDVA